MSHSGTWGCCHQAFHEAEGNVGFFPPSMKRNQYHLLQNVAYFTGTEFLRFIPVNIFPGEGNDTKSGICLCWTHCDSELKIIVSSQPHLLSSLLENLFKSWLWEQTPIWEPIRLRRSHSGKTKAEFEGTAVFFLSLPISLYSPHAAAPVSPAPTDALEWGCHPWVSNPPGSLLLAHMPQKYRGLSSSSFAFLSRKNNIRHVKNIPRGMSLRKSLTN